MEICFIVVMPAMRRDGSSKYSASHTLMRNWLRSGAMVVDGGRIDGSSMIVSVMASQHMLISGWEGRRVRQFLGRGRCRRRL